MSTGSGRSAIWGGATIGLIIGAIIGLINKNFWPDIAKGILIGAVAGIAAEILSMIGNKLRK